MLILREREVIHYAHDAALICHAAIIAGIMGLLRTSRGRFAGGRFIYHCVIVRDAF